MGWFFGGEGPPKRQTESVVVNLSDRVLTRTNVEALNKGLEYVATPQYWALQIRTDRKWGNYLETLWKIGDLRN